MTTADRLTFIGTGVAIIAAMFTVWLDVRTDLRGIDARLRSVEQSVAVLDERIRSIDGKLDQMQPSLADPPHK